MFEKYMIVDSEVENIVDNGEITGFRFGARLPYYRGIALSLLDDIAVSVDGVSVPREKLTFSAHGNTYSLAELEAATDDRWNMGEVAHISVQQPGELPPGEHSLHLLLNMRIAYLPFPSIRQSTVTIALSDR